MDVMGGVRLTDGSQLSVVTGDRIGHVEPFQDSSYR